MTSDARHPAALRVGAFALRVRRRPLLVAAVLGVSVLVVGAVSLAVGDYPLSLPQLVRTLSGGGSGAEGFVVLDIRLPRWATAALVGAALAIAGALFQSLSRNPLGSPDIVGFTSGSSAGALVVIVLLGGSGPLTAVGAVVGGLVAAVAVSLLALRGGIAGYRLVLVGIGVAAMLGAVELFLLSRAGIAEAQAAATWIAGSVNNAGWVGALPVALALLVLGAPAAALGRSLDLLELGDDAARGLGIGVERTRIAVVLVAVALTATACAAAGPIAFVALTAPQIARRLTRLPGPNVTVSALTGAVVVTVADLLAQHLFAEEVPVGVVTGAVGGVYLATLLATEFRKGRG